jgi:regulator of replication initiation timing
MEMTGMEADPKERLAEIRSRLAELKQEREALQAEREQLRAALGREPRQQNETGRRKG